MATDLSLSVPLHRKSPGRALTDAEREALIQVADVLVGDTGELPPPSAAPGFAAALDVALAARDDAFEDIVAAATALYGEDGPALDSVRKLAADEPDTFQPLSAVLGGAYLLLPEVGRTIGYPGQVRSHPRFDEAAEEITNGILDPVIERGPVYRTA